MKFDGIVFFARFTFLMQKVLDTQNDCFNYSCYVTSSWLYFEELCGFEENIFGVGLFHFCSKVIVMLVDIVGQYRSLHCRPILDMSMTMMMTELT